MRTSRATRAVLAVATATILAAAGCGSDTTAAERGTEPATPPGQQSTGGIDIASLDTGEHRVEPRDFVGENFAAGEAGPVIEGQRMAEFVVHPHDLDPTLTTGGASTGVSVSTDRILADGAGDLLEPCGMITGFRTSRSTEDESGMLQVAVARFATPEDAAQAARVVHDFERVDRTTPLASDPSIVTGIPPAVPVAVPGAPETLASVRSWDVIGRVTTTTITPQGSFVIHTYASSETGDVAWTTDIAARAARAQATLLDGFPATPVEEIGDLPMDVDRVLARAVGLPEGALPRLSDLAVYGPDGWLHFDSHPARTERIFEVTGTDRIAKAASNVYRTAGPAEAELLRDDFVETIREMHPDLVEDETVPQDIPGTRCWSGDVAQGRASVCLIVHGRYMAELSGLRPVGTRLPRTTRFVRCHSGWPPST
ncbi:DUF7373 family lipoprotein [Rhodococcus rhodochrous]|uniref:DUF7373 family lipoprotein n=1 Tax=Rhodococcus rhodochrous TaxID=1829 RepID=UPI001F474692